MECYHVYPVNDIVEHDTQSDHCACHPKIEYVCHWKIVIHNSWDQRELFEMETAEA